MLKKSKLRIIRQSRFIRTFLRLLLQSLPRTVLKGVTHSVENAEIMYNPKTQDIVIRIRKEV